MAFKESLCAPRNYDRLPCCVRSSGGSAETRFLGFYHGFGHVSRRFVLFLALTPSGDSPKAGGTKWEKSLEELGENVQAKSRRCFRFRIIAVRLFVTAPGTGPLPACRVFRGILL